MGKLSRDKGHAWEREVAKRLTEATGVECRRCLIETQQGNRGDIASSLDMVVQCKVGAVPPVWSALMEAQEVAEGETIPVAILKRNRSGNRPPAEVAVLPLEDFLGMVRKLKAAGVL